MLAYIFSYDLYEVLIQWCVEYNKRLDWNEVLQLLLKVFPYDSQENCTCIWEHHAHPLGIPIHHTILYVIDFLIIIIFQRRIG